MHDDKQDDIQDAVIARAAELGLTAYAIAAATRTDLHPRGVSERHVREYLGRRASMGSHRLQHVLRVLGLAVMREP